MGDGGGALGAAERARGREKRGNDRGGVAAMKCKKREAGKQLSGIK